MSTRAVIARKTNNGFKGVYHHWDGYPESLGCTLFNVRKSKFKGSTKAMLEALIDAHPAGWSTINSEPWECYCHGERNEWGQEVTERNAGGIGCEWAYVFDGKDNMEIQCSYCDPEGQFAGRKMIGAFGCGDHKSVWKAVFVVDLNGKEPDWEKIQNDVCGGD